MEKEKVSRAVAFIAAIALNLSVFSGCSQGGGSASAALPSSAAASGESAGLDEGGVTNASGLPITKKPITIKAALSYSAIRPDMATSNIWKTVSEKTNINFEVETFKDADKVDLMFASGDFPDLLMNVGANSNQITTAVDSGYFVELEPLLKQYAPTWYKFMKNNSLVYNSSLATDGKLYGLPYFDADPADRNIRDEWGINQKWLDELNLKVPTTTDEFKNVLLAFKKDAGKGSIPADVLPYYFLFDSYIGGQFDLYGSFGVYITSGDYLYVDNGTVKDQSTNPAIKEPLKYLKDLYSLGLIPPEVFTDDWNTYVSKTSSATPVTGSYGAYVIRPADTYSYLKPLNSGNGKKPLMRSQAYTPGPANAAIITTKNKYPIATTRLFEQIASNPEFELTVSRGAKGVLWDEDSAGKAYQLFWEESTDKMQQHSKDIGLHNSFIALKDENFYKNVWKDVTAEKKGSRAWAYYNTYKDCVMPNDYVYVSGSLNTDDTNMMNQYGSDLTNYRKSMFADFITGKRNIDAEWETYVSKMKELGLDQYVALKQKGYDLLVK